MNKIATFDFHLGALDRAGNNTSGIVDLGGCRNVGLFSVQCIMTAAAVSVIGEADDWTEDASEPTPIDGLWHRTWDEATYGTPTSLYFNGTLGTVDATPDTVREWTFDGDTNTLSVFTATGTNNPATYYTTMVSYGSPTLQLDYLASNDGVNYVVGGGGTAIATGVAVGTLVPTAFTPPLCRWLKLKATEEDVAAVGSVRLILAVQ